MRLFPCGKQLSRESSKISRRQTQSRCRVEYPFVCFGFRRGDALRHHTFLPSHDLNDRWFLINPDTPIHQLPCSSRKRDTVELSPTTLTSVLRHFPPESQSYCRRAPSETRHFILLVFTFTGLRDYYTSSLHVRKSDCKFTDFIVGGVVGLDMIPSHLSLVVGSQIANDLSHNFPKSQGLQTSETLLQCRSTSITLRTHRTNFINGDLLG